MVSELAAGLQWSQGWLRWAARCTMPAREPMVEDRQVNFAKALLDRRKVKMSFLPAAVVGLAHGLVTLVYVPLTGGPIL